jgi:tetratricopeptide (TPR) repeat protein
VNVAADALDRACRHPGEPVAVVGPAGAGKSGTAQAIAQLAASDAMLPIIVSPASGAADAGALIVAGVVRRLGGHLQPSRSWQQALRTASKLLHRNTERLLVICDEPNRWTIGGGYFARRADDAVDLLLGPTASWPAVVCDQTAGGYEALPLPAASITTLRDVGSWGELAKAAAYVADHLDASEFETPLKQRLAVAVVAWDPDGPPPPTQTAELAWRLAETLVARRHGRRLWTLWQRLALARIHLEDEVLGELGATNLTPLAEATLRHVLLDGAGRLHDALRRIPDERPVDPEMHKAARRDSHELLYEHHYERFRTLAAADDPTAGEHAAEALHHAGELADHERLDVVRVELSDQLNALGTRLMDLHEDHESAATVFLRAVQTNAGDGYAHHGRARSLDVLGQDPDEVEREYDRALDLEPLQPAWHAHRVSLLADLGRLEDARRAWAQAESALLNGAEHASVYEALHAYVAACLLAIGELPFATYVLEGVPDWARDVEHRRLNNVLAGRLAAEEDGAFVPAPRSGRAWWREDPQVLPRRDTDGRQLAQWAAGRVEHVDAEGVHLHLAQVGLVDDQPDPSWTVIAPDAWESRCLDGVPADQVRPGRFVEIGRYRSEAEDARTAIRLVPVTLLPEGRYRPLSPVRWATR